MKNLKETVNILRQPSDQLQKIDSDMYTNKFFFKLSCNLLNSYMQKIASDKCVMSLIFLAGLSIITIVILSILKKNQVI